ncbi:BLUF domain-containing protein [Microbacterium invictum]|uniref:BLUF domain-containing protein n=1 Tax=Microbacterium invictum TaxID=515415 RepID=A0ABZ0VB38_9MICO|nr:BLUF domain-containing protein [Microbacterium invictum]WQB69770.1 BLUF domain-containing protein [Microbacterium invictum]
MSITAGDQLVSVVYVSRAKADVGDDTLRDILTESRENNAQSGVTGVLLYREGQFVQVLEGPRDTVESLVRTITDDPRHTDIRVVLDEPIDERQFGEWTMEFRPVAPPTAALPEGFRDTFDDLDAAESPAGAARAIHDIGLWVKARTARG